MVCNLGILKAQSLASWGLFAGPSTRSLTYGSSNIFSSPDLGLDAGILAEFRFSEHFSFQPMVEYSAQGSKHGSFVSSLNYTDPQYANDVKFGELNYLMVPLLAKFGWQTNNESHVRFFFNVGPYAAFLISANQVLINSNQQKVGGTTEDVKSELNTFNAGIDGNIGVSYYFQTSSIFVQIGGNYGFLKLQKDQSAGANYAGAASISIGYTFWFDNNFLVNGHFSPRN
jgi:hypothetical protein